MVSEFFIILFGNIYFFDHSGARFPTGWPWASPVPYMSFIRTPCRLLRGRKRRLGRTAIRLPKFSTSFNFMNPSGLKFIANKEQKIYRKIFH
jgi:hypothetical protein